jgi:hypothetical protein
MIWCKHFNFLLTRLLICSPSDHVRAANDVVGESHVPFLVDTPAVVPPLAIPQKT